MDKISKLWTRVNIGLGMSIGGTIVVVATLNQTIIAPFVMIAGSLINLRSMFQLKKVGVKFSSARASFKKGSREGE